MRKSIGVVLLLIIALTGCSGAMKESISGVYQFDDFGESCTRNCMITVEIDEIRMSVVMSDDFGTYPMWYGSVDSVKMDGTIASKRTDDPDEIAQLEESVCGLNNPYRSFMYRNNAIAFDIRPGGEDFHVSATRIS